MRTPSFCELSVRVFKGLIHLTDYEKWMTFSHILSCVRNDYVLLTINEPSCPHSAVNLSLAILVNMQNSIRT